jgi:pimeloyl-ACP methyl ester carboxylesterase
MCLRQFAITLPMLAATLSALPAQSHQLVSVGDHQLDVVREGSGGPALVFETGLADSLDSWLPTAHTVSEFTTTIAYSRAGFGRSGAGSSDHSVTHDVQDLHALLQALAIKPPFILVAHSYGGIIARLYVSTYPRDVAGIVLVDGTHEQQVERWNAIDGTYAPAFRKVFDSMATQTPPGARAAEIRETMKIQAAGGVPGLTPLPDIPMAIITSMRANDSSRYVNDTRRGHELWRAMHDEWFRRSRNAIHIVTTHSGHDIAGDEPALVEMAIRFVLDRVRAQ